jgi:hypothetical protein
MACAFDNSKADYREKDTEFTNEKTTRPNEINYFPLGNPHFLQ